jgi:hypothetical protein
MSDMDTWQAAQFADELATMRQVVETIEASTQRPLTADERRLLAWATGTKPEIH